MRGYGVWFFFLTWLALVVARYVDKQWEGLIETEHLYALALGLAGLVCVAAGVIINRPFQGVDKMTGMMVTIKSWHTVTLGIPVQHWGLVLLLAAGAVMLRPLL
jgi:hypothetical protein